MSLGTRLLRLATAVVVASGVGCASADGALLVAVRTDLLSGTEVAAVQCVLDGVGRVRTFVGGVDLLGAPSVCAFRGLAERRYDLELTLLDSAGRLVVGRPLQVVVRGRTLITIPLGRDCAGVSCPDASEPSATACLGGRCVDPGCAEETASECDSGRCERAEECPATTGACGARACIAGTCFVDGRGTCSDGLVCDPDVGCVTDGSHVCPDGGVTGSPPAEVALVYPWNGLTTGSVHAASGATVDTALRPRLMWRPTPESTSYEVEMDDSCAVSTFRECAFDSPEVRETTTATVFRPAASLAVSMTAPVGRRYTWRVRACNAAGCGPYSEPRYLDVGRLSDDFDGDGYTDVAVGAPRQDAGASDEGNTFVYLGGPRGVGATPSITLDNPANDAGGSFGAAVSSAGDVNGDGFADLVVGAVEQDNGSLDEGNAFLYLGGPSGLGTVPAVVLDNPTNDEDGSFGCAVASAGDVNGDGYSDVLIGAVEQDGRATREGSAFLYYGGPLGVGSTPTVTLANPTSQMDGLFGVAVATAGDLDGDGYADVVVGARGQDGGTRDEGMAFIYRGGVGGVATTPSVALENPMNQTAGEFGFSVSGAGDLNGDGYSDLVVGAFLQDGVVVDQGLAFVYVGGADGIAGTPSSTLTSPTAQSGAAFGGAVVGAGDIDGDGYADLLIGSPLHDGGAADEGSVFVYLGDSSGAPAIATIAVPNPSSQSGAFGAHVEALGDVDGDGFADFEVTAPNQDNGADDEGNAFLYLGGPRATSLSPALVLDNPTNQAGGLFGS